MAHIAYATPQTYPMPSRAEHYPWMDKARCAGMPLNFFFPDKGRSPNAAKAFCEPCPAKDACLEFALKNNERFGVFGGKSERERRRIAVARRIEAS